MIKMTKFSTSWKSSKKPRKQRNFVKRAYIHLRGRFFNAHLSDELSKKYSIRALRLRKGDRVKIMKGQFKGKTGKVEGIDSANIRVYVEGLEVQKKDGTKVKFSVHPSNLMITELNLSDKKRQDIIKRKSQ